MPTETPPEAQARTPDDQEWQMMQSDWLTLDAGPAGPVDFAALTARTRRETRRQWRGLAIEIAACVALFVFWGMRMAARPSLAMALLGWGSVAFAAVWLFTLTRTLRGTWRADALTCDAFLDLRGRRLAASLRWTRWVRWHCLALGGGVALWSLWVWFRTEIYVERPQALLIGLLGIYGILGGIVVVNRRKRRALLADRAEWQRLVGE